MTPPPDAPVRLTPSHDVSAFACGVQELDDWLKRRALPNDVSRASRTFVAAAGDRVVGYYALATGAASQKAATGRVRRNIPEPIPVMVLARLAVDRAYQGTGLGAGLLKDALLRTLNVAEMTGIRAVLLHAISDDAKRFYAGHGFAESPLDPMIMMVTLADIETSLRVATRAARVKE